MKSNDAMERLTGISARCQTTGGISGDVLLFSGPGAGNLQIEPGDFVAAVVISQDKLMDILTLLGRMSFTFETTLFEKVEITIRPRPSKTNDYETNPMQENGESHVNQ